MRDIHLQFDKIKDNFQSVLKEVFTNQSTCEEAELHYFCLENLNQIKSIYYDGDLIVQSPVSDVSLQQTNYNQSAYQTGTGKFGGSAFGMKQDTVVHIFSGGKYKEVIRAYLQRVVRRNNYLVEESPIFISKESTAQSKIYWILFSECLDSNKGRILLWCVFQEFVKKFNPYLKTVMEGGEADGDDPSLLQSILYAAEARVTAYLQCMFAPFNIDMVNRVSGEYYEKADCESNMIFLPQKASDRLSDKDLFFSFGNKELFIPSNCRLIRKQLEMAQEEMYLVLTEERSRNSFRSIGISEKVSLDEKLKRKKDGMVPYIRVNFRRHMQWDLWLNDTYIFTYRHGHYKVEQELQDNCLIKRLKEYFGKQQDDYRALLGIVKESTKQPHGTMLVIMESDHAEEEAKRIGDKGYGFLNGYIKKAEKKDNQRKNLQQEINQLTAIDGSVILDTFGEIYGVGMILDGNIIQAGTPERGARYNSALKYLSYIHQKSWKAMILVVSEDGIVDIISTKNVS